MTTLLTVLGIVLAALLIGCALVWLFVYGANGGGRR